MRIICLLLFFYFSNLFAQPILNERYKLGAQNTIFGSVAAFDSLYLVAGINGNGNVFSRIGIISLMNSNGDTTKIVSVENDTMGFDFFFKAHLLPTQDGHFALISNQFTQNRQWSLRFLLLDSTGSIQVSSEIYEITDNTNYYVVATADIIEQKIDSSFTAIVTLINESNGTSNVLLINLSKIGNLNWYKIILAPNPNAFRLLIPRDIVQKADGNYILSTNTFKTSGPIEAERGHIRIIEVDNSGNIVNSFTDNSQPMDTGGEGLTLIEDGSIIFARQRGFWQELSNWLSSSQIVCLDSLNNENWVLEVGGYGGEGGTNINEILPLANQEFVAVGAYLDTVLIIKPGTLLKFNSQGDKIWQRFYQKVPKVGNGELPRHILYDVAQTPDSGFVMVGEARNYANPNHEMGQLGWLVKTDKYGCLVPGCQQYDNIDTTTVDTTDTIIDPPPPPTPEIGLKIYPNPASQELYIYYASENHTGSANAFLYNTQGQIINEWPLNINFTTYMLDVSTYASGMYVLKVVDGEEVLKTEKVIVQ